MGLVLVRGGLPYLNFFRCVHSVCRRPVKVTHFEDVFKCAGIARLTLSQLKPAGYFMYYRSPAIGGRYSDSLRAERSGDRIPVGVARFSALLQTDPRAHPDTCTKGTGSFPGGKAAGAWR